MIVRCFSCFIFALNRKTADISQKNNTYSTCNLYGLRYSLRSFIYIYINKLYICIYDTGYWKQSQGK